MAAIIIRENARGTWLTGIAGVRAKARRKMQRGMAYAAAAILIGGVGAALLELVAEILSFPVPIAATAITLLAAAVLHSLRRARTSRGGIRTVGATRGAPSGKHAGT
jgi:hypothetical protein